MVKLIVISCSLFLVLLSSSGSFFSENYIQQSQSPCTVTTSDVLGPYYRPEAPIRNNIRRDVDVNNLIEINGVVKLNDCKTKLKGVTIEFWQANSNGYYDNDSKSFYYRAKLKTDSKGAYSLKTILPGRVMVDGKFLPAHINFRVTSASTEELVSQLYFEGDPYLNPTVIQSQKAFDRVIQLEEAKGGEKRGNFNIVLKKKE